MALIAVAAALGALVAIVLRRRATRPTRTAYEATVRAFEEGSYGRVLEVGGVALRNFKPNSRHSVLLHWTMGQAAFMMGAYPLAQQHFDDVHRAVALSTTRYPEVDRQLLLIMRGLTALQQARHDDALQQLEAALDVGPDLQRRGQVCRYMAQVEASRERYEEAHVLLEESQTHPGGAPDEYGYHRALGGEVLLPQGDLVGARRHLSLAEDGYRELGWLVDVGSAKAYRGEAAMMEGDASGAVVLLREALTLVTSRPDNLNGESYVLLRLALAEIAVGDIESAGSRIERVAEIAPTIGSAENQARIAWAQGRLAAAEGRGHEARGFLAHAVEGFERVGKPSVAMQVQAEIDNPPPLQ